MTFSICVREPIEDESGPDHRFGVAVTTRLAGVGNLCPFVDGSGAVATQSLVNVSLGRRGVEYLAEGLAVDDALPALLNADPEKEVRQLHGVDAETGFAFSGEDCRDWFGHECGDGHTVAGNLLVGPEVIDATASAYTEIEPDDAPLADRLVDALAAGHDAGGDRRTELPIQSAAVRVREAESIEEEPLYNDLRVDATESPIADLRGTLALARESHEQMVERAEAE